MFLPDNKKIIIFVIGIWSLGFIPIIIGVGGCAWVVREGTTTAPLLTLSYQVTGGLPGDAFGTKLSASGDVDSDGKADFLVGAPLSSPDGKMGGGSAYVISGGDGKFLLTLEGYAEDGQFGVSLSLSEDIDNDGKADLIVGAQKLNSGRGAVYVYSGATGSLLWQKSSDVRDDNLGAAVASIGDINGDGTKEVMVGVPYSDASGKNDAGAIQIYSARDGTLLSQKNGEAENDHFGMVVAPAGDINGDGRPDYLVAAPDANPVGKTDAGSIYVYSGADGSLLYQKNGETANDHFGTSLASGDINADGKSDFIIGAPSADNTKGSVYVYSGSDGELLYPKKSGSTVGSNFGTSLASGDINADSKSDFIVGALGAVSVFSGADGSVLFQKEQTGNFGSAVAAGDVNGDGKSDLLVGDNSSNNGRGAVYVYISP